MFKLDKCSKFRLQCIQNETRLKQITNRVNEQDNSNSSEVDTYNYSNTQEPHKQEYIVEDSVVMVVDPSLDYDSSEDSDNADQADMDVAERDNTPEGDPMPESFFKMYLCVSTVIKLSFLKKNVRSMSMHIMTPICLSSVQNVVWCSLNGASMCSIQSKFMAMTNHITALNVINVLAADLI